MRVLIGMINKNALPASLSPVLVCGPFADLRRCYVLFSPYWRGFLYLCVTLFVVACGSSSDSGDETVEEPPVILFVTNARDGNFEIYSMSLDGSDVTNLTGDPDIDAFPVLSPDNTRVAFISARDGLVDLFVMNADGSRQRNLTQNPASDAGGEPSTNGNKPLFRVIATATARSTS